MKRLVSIAVVALAAGWTLSLSSAADDEKPKNIKEVMKLHKDKLNEKFAKGEATAEEKKKLLTGYEAMLKFKPPKGDEAEFKKKVEALVKSVKDDDKEAYKKAVNCGACHGAHK